LTGVPEFPAPGMARAPAGKMEPVLQKTRSAEVVQDQQRTNRLGGASMTRFFRVSAIAAAALALAVPAMANIPDPGLSVVPHFITIAPNGGGATLKIEVQVNGALGGVDGAIVEIEFGEEATALIAWSNPVPGGASVPTQICPTRKYVAAADVTGKATFHIAGGGCIKEPDFTGASFIARVTADNILLAEVEVNSPDVVDAAGQLATDLDAPVCDGGLMSVGLADAVFHASFFKTGNYEKCSDLGFPYLGTIGLEDATIGSVFIKGGTSASCYAGCP